MCFLVSFALIRLRFGGSIRLALVTWGSPVGGRGWAGGGCMGIRACREAVLTIAHIDK